MDTISDIRRNFRNLLTTEEYVIDKSGVKTIEIINARFIADQPAIYGSPNEDWHRRELDWYKKMSLNVNDIEEPIPVIWKQVATPDGRINSNYGWCVWSEENGRQYCNVVSELKKNPFSRRASMIYTRPSMHSEYNKDGMSDFICTYGTQHYIRDGQLITSVLMRSNDAIMGYKGDFSWQKHVHDTLANDLQVIPGDIIWNAMSLHVYERHFYLIK